MSDDVWAEVERRLDNENHEQLCNCPLWPESCSTYGDKRPWSLSAERAVELALEAVSASPLVADRQMMREFMGSLGVDWLFDTPDTATDELFASGVVQSKGDAQAEALEEAAEWYDRQGLQAEGDILRDRAAAYRTPASPNSEES